MFLSQDEFPSMAFDGNVHCPVDEYQAGGGRCPDIYYTPEALEQRRIGLLGVSDPERLRAQILARSEAYISSVRPVLPEPVYTILPYSYPDPGGYLEVHEGDFSDSYPESYIDMPLTVSTSPILWEGDEEDEEDEEFEEDEEMPVAQPVESKAGFLIPAGLALLLLL